MDWFAGLTNSTDIIVIDMGNEVIMKNEVFNLRDYQNSSVVNGLNILNKHKLLMLIMQVRTGKTFTSMEIAKRYGAKAVLFITKKKAISSIDEDYITAKHTYKFLCTNYEQVKNIEESFDFIIIDECHSLNQYPKASQRTKLIKQIAKDKPIIFLSGTVSPESYSGLFYQLWVSSYSPWREYNSFYKWCHAGYVTVKQKFIGAGRRVNDYSCGNKTKILLDINKYFITVSQEEAGFKQKPVEKFLTCNMTDKTGRVIKRLLKDKVLEGKEDAITCDSGVKLKSKILQLCGGSVITDSGNAIIFDKSKAEFIKEYFKDSKIGIFYVFKAEKEMLIEAFGEDNITESPEEFNECKNKVFISQIKSGREGINLKTADCLVMYGIDYAAVSYFQAIHRHQYINRATPLLIYWVFSQFGLERKVYDIVSNKQTFTMSYFKKEITKCNFIPQQKQGGLF